MEITTDSPVAFARRRRSTLTSEVRDALESMILSGEVQAGERLNEHLLAEQMGVSRGPVREAARALERDGLLTSVINRGVFVRDLSVDEALELYELRALIAGHLCALVAETADSSVKSDLRAFIERMESAALAGDEETYFAENLAFHHHIAVASGARRSVDLYTSLGKEVRLMRSRVLRGKESLEFSNTEHKRIVAAIEAGDCEQARNEGMQHHRNGKKRWLETL
jgi:DNA-binding GntR family transcriptional regulator